MILAHPDACGVLLVDSESVDGRLLDFGGDAAAAGEYVSVDSGDGAEKKVLSPIVAMALHPGGSMLGCFTRDQRAVIASLDFKTILLDHDCTALLGTGRGGAGTGGGGGGLGLASFYGLDLGPMHPQHICWAGSDLSLVMSFARPSWAPEATGVLVIGASLSLPLSLSLSLSSSFPLSFPFPFLFLSLPLAL